MKNRLQKLWDKTAPGGGPCPRPDAKAVQRRVDAALDEGRRAFHLRRKLKLAALCAAALVLLTGAAAVVDVAWPEYNVLGAFFQGDAEQWKNMVNTQPVTVSDDNYTLTLTSSLADRTQLFYTVTLEAKSDEAWEALQKQMEESFGDLWSFRFHGTMGMSGENAPENRTAYFEVSTERTLGNFAGIRLELMKEGVWLNFSYTPVSDLSLDINADGPARTDRILDPFEGTVTLKRLTLSPFTVQAKYITEDTDLFPVLQFLWEDGTYSEVELGASGKGHGRSTEDGRWDHTMSYSFDSVQDLSTLEAVIFNGMAYPLDGGEPYEVDVSAIPRPFVVPIGEAAPSGDWTVPLFALCEGLGADCRWDEAAGVAAASFRDTTLTFTVGSKTVQVDGPWSWDATDEDIAPVYRDGELWVDSAPLLRTVWSVELSAAVEDWDNRQVAEDGSVAPTSWVVNP